MPIFSPIPMPGSGMKALSSGLDTIFADLLNKKKLAQQNAQFQQELALRKQAAARAAQAASDAHRLALMKLDPNREVNELKRMMAAFGQKPLKATEQESYITPIGDTFAGDTATPSIDDSGLESAMASVPEIPGILYKPASFIPSYDDPVVTKREDKPRSLQSFIQQGLQGRSDKAIPQINDEAVSAYDEAQSKADGLDLDMIKSSPILRGWFKKHYGFDPGAPVPQTPEEKLQEKLRLHQENRLFDIEHPTQSKEPTLQGSAREAVDLDRLKKQYGEDSEVYQQAKADHDAKVDAKKDLRDLRARTKAGLKPGEKEFFDEQTGAPLGKEIPLTEKERDAEQGSILFNELYPYVYKGASPFSGEGSITRLEQAAANYKTNPQAQKLFDDFLLAEKMLAATTVNEASTLKAGKTNNTYRMLKASLEAQDVPERIKSLIKQFQIPASAQLKAAMRYQKLLSDARIKSKKLTPATQRLYYNPEMQAKHEAEQAEGKPVNHSVQTVLVVDPSGKKFQTTEENAAHLPEGWKRG